MAQIGQFTLNIAGQRVCRGLRSIAGTLSESTIIAAKHGISREDDVYAMTHAEKVAELDG